MQCAKQDGADSLQEFVLVSPAPVDSAAKLSAEYAAMSEQDKHHTAQLIKAAK